MIRMKKLLAVILSACMALTMFPLMAFADETTSETENLPESDHNYADNYDNTWTYQMDCAHNGLYVTFDEQTKTESNYDFIYILDGNDNQIGKYTGTELAGKTVYVPTPAFKVRLTSDRSSTEWGFKVSGVQMVEDYIDLSKVGTVDVIAPVFVNEEVVPVVRVNGQALSADTDFDVSAVSNTIGIKTATITGKGSYTGTLEADYQVVDEDNLAEGASVSQANISLRQSSDIGSSYVLFNNATTAWTSSVESMTLTPVESDGTTKTDTGSATYPNAPKEITLTADQLKVNGNRISFERTAENPVVYVMEGHNPIEISSRWGANTYPQSQNYLVTVKARGYKDTTGTTTYYTGTAPEFSIIIDSDGDASTTDDRTVAKSWSSSEISEKATFANGSSQCGMTGFRTFSGEGVSLKDLLAEADVSVSDSDYFLLDTSDHYGNYFTYASLFGTKRYFMSSIYEDGFADYYSGLAASDNESGSVAELRRYLAAHATNKDVIEPRINVNYVETMISGDDLADAVLPTSENQNYNSLVSYENQFRFFYGIALVQDEHTVTYVDNQGGTKTESQLVKSHPMTSTENSTMKSSYWANSLVIFRGAGEQYKTEPSTALNKITRPVDPCRVGYTFAGWYTDPDCKDGTEFDFAANDGYVDEDITLYAKWTEGATLPESDHEYVSSTDRTWSYDYGEGADNGIVVKFSEDTSTENSYDFIYVYDGDGNELGKYTGKELAGQSVYIPTSKVQIRLTSDRSYNDYGFKVESIEPNGETIDLGQFGKMDKIEAVEVNGQPGITVKVNNTPLTENVDYTVSYDTSTAGVKTATVTGTGKYSGTLSKDFIVYTRAIRITDFDIANKEHNDEDGELNQTIIATITFSNDIKMTADTLSDDLLITIAGGDVNNTARNVTYEVDGNKLIITMVSTDWVAIYNGVLSISESDNGLFHLTGTTDGSAVLWETQTDNIPIGIVVANDMTPGTASNAASTVATVTHKANMRGMYHFQLLSIINGEETEIASGTSHAHNFYGSITKESIAKAISNFVNNQDGYSSTCNDGENTFTITADTPVEGQILAIRMIENKASIVYSGTTTLPESDHEYESSTDESWYYDSIKGADNGLVVKFSEDTSTEKNYDFIYIYDGDGNELGKYSGKELAGQSVYVPTSKLRIRLTSDRSANDYGFKVESIEPNGDTIDLGQFGEMGKIEAVEVNGQSDITVTLNNTPLTENVDYTVSYDTSAAGVKTATVTGIGKYSGTLTKDFVVYDKAIKITDFDITNTEHNDEDGELNQTIIATVTFDSDVKMTADTLKDDLLITIAGGDVNNTARNVTYEVDGNKLIITMVSTDWVAIYNGILSISESDNGLLHLTGTTDGNAVVWETQTDRIPIGITLVNDASEGTASSPASTVVNVTHKANMRGMYFFELVSTVDGNETVINEQPGVSHAHNFYGSITKEAIANAISNYVNSLDGYTTTYNEGEDHFTVTADNAVEGQKLAVRMVENKAKITYTADLEAAAAAEEAINAIGEVTEDSGDAIEAARTAYDELTDDQKALVSDEAKKALEDAEAAYQELQPDESPYSPSTRPSADQKAASAVEDKINAIGTVTEQSGDAIKAAREAYDALTDPQKALVSDAAKKALEDAEAAFEALNNTPEPTDTNPYSDVKEDAWYYDNVLNVTKKGIFQGTGDGLFNPESDMTRAEFAQVLYNMEGKPAVTGNAGFSDVASGSWYADAVNWAATTDSGNGEKLIMGYPNGEYQPDATITREQMATLIFRYASYKKADTSKRDSLAAFSDRDSVQSYALNAVQWAVAEGIINGMTATTLEPASNTTRAQVAAVLDRFTDNL